MEIKEQIKKQLKEIENKYDVTILYAAESGSRAWGFPSKDSDFDVRFIYAHKKEWYLHIHGKRDVIELPVDKVLDINGWDIKKAFQLLRKSNIPLLEWLASPIGYVDIGQASAPLKSLKETAFMPESACHHYLSMAHKMMEKIKHAEKVRIKTYLYALRPILSVQWVIAYGTQPPMEFQNLLKKQMNPHPLRDTITEMIQQKLQSNEKDGIDHVDELERYLVSQMEVLKKQIPKNREKCDIERYNTAFRETLDILAEKR